MQHVSGISRIGQRVDENVWISGADLARPMELRPQTSHAIGPVSRRENRASLRHAG